MSDSQDKNKESIFSTIFKGIGNAILKFLRGIRNVFTEIFGSNITEDTPDEGKSKKTLKDKGEKQEEINGEKPQKDISEKPENDINEKPNENKNDKIEEDTNEKPENDINEKPNEYKNDKIEEDISEKPENDINEKPTENKVEKAEEDNEEKTDYSNDTNANKTQLDLLIELCKENNIDESIALEVKELYESIFPDATEQDFLDNVTKEQLEAFQNNPTLLELAKKSDSIVKPTWNAFFEEVKKEFTESLKQKTQELIQNNQNSQELNIVESKENKPDTGPSIG